MTTPEPASQQPQSPKESTVKEDDIEKNQTVGVTTPPPDPEGFTTPPPPPYTPTHTPISSTETELTDKERVTKLEGQMQNAFKFLSCWGKEMDALQLEVRDLKKKSK